MNTLMPDVADAILIHDMAHEQQSEEIHGVALKLLSIAGLEHVRIDALDIEQTGWDKLPGAFRVKEEVAAFVADNDGTINKSELVTDYGMADMFVAVLLEQSVDRAKPDSLLHQKHRIPAYEMWMIRKQMPEEVIPESAFTIGQYVPVGYPRKQGAYRFPAIAQEVHPGYKMIQVHKDGEDVVIFDKSGEQVSGMADVVDWFVAMDYPQSAIFECITIGENKLVAFFDVLLFDGIDCTKLTYQQRLKVVDHYQVQDPVYCEWMEYSYSFRNFIKTQDDLHRLSGGQFVIRYQDEVLTDLVKPFWFYYEAGIVKPGIVLPWLSPTGLVDKDFTADKIMVPIVSSLPNLQIHKTKDSISIFMADGGRNRAAHLRKVVEMFQNVPESFIMDAVWTCTDMNVPISVERAQSGKYDLSGCKVDVYPFDLAYWAGESIVNMPMYERVEMLEKIVDDIDREYEVHRYDSVEADSYMVFIPDSERPLTAGPHEHCWLFSK